MSHKRHPYMPHKSFGEYRSSVRGARMVARSGGQRTAPRATACEWCGGESTLGLPFCSESCSRSHARCVAEDAAPLGEAREIAEL